MDVSGVGVFYSFKDLGNMIYCCYGPSVTSTWCVPAGTYTAHIDNITHNNLQTYQKTSKQKCITVSLNSEHP